MSKKTFEVGDMWLHQMVVGWAMIRSTITSRNGNVVTEKQEWRAEDSGEMCSCEEEREVYVDENGVEYIVIGSLYGEEFRGYASECE